MFFPTLEFGIFFTIVLFFYWYVFRQEKHRKILLTISSYIFYAFWDIRFCVLLFFFTLLNYCFGCLLDAQKDYVPRKVIVIFITIIDILYLCFFKYLYSILSLLDLFFPGVNNNCVFLLKLKEYSILFPIGVSYYTFKSLSYIFDIYLCKIRNVKSFWDILLYISFFPQISLGPIVQAEYFFKKLPDALNSDSGKIAKPIQLDRAVILLISGIYKKLIIANFLTILVTDKIFSNPAFYNTIELIFGILCYTVIIYADFSGYSDMAIGIGLLLGFETPPNFQRPYLSASISEFWRRWHISFSSWLRDYLYFGLGGARFGLIKNLFALFFTMVIAGFWHGARLTFVIWGALQGFALVVEKLFSLNTRIKKIEEINENKLSLGVELSEKNIQKLSFKKIMKITVTFIFINFSWLIFFSNSITELKKYIISFKNINMPFKIITPFIFFIFLMGLCLQLPSETMRKKLFYFYVKIPLVIKAGIISAICILFYSVSTSGIPAFIYFNF